MNKPKQQKKPLVVVKKKKSNSKVVKRTRNVGLPKFETPASLQGSESGSLRLRNGTDTSDQNVQDGDDLDNFLDDDTDDFPSEAMMAIDHLSSSRLDVVLSIPINGSRSIFGVMECQIQEFFRSKKTGSSRSLSHDLDTLVNSSKIVLLTAPNDYTSATSINLYVKTSDYFIAARDALTANPELSEWFCKNVVTNGQSKLSRREIVGKWDQSCKLSNHATLPTADSVIRTLQDRQVLLAVTQDLFQLTLPSWGSLVLPAFQKASKDAQIFIKQSRYGERSVSSLKKRLSRSPIPVTGLLLPWMVSQGLIHRHEKPSGEFVSLPKS